MRYGGVLGFERAKDGNLTDNRGIRGKFIENMGGGIALLLGSADVAADGISKFTKDPKNSTLTGYRLFRETSLLTAIWAGERAIKYFQANDAIPEEGPNLTVVQSDDGSNGTPPPRSQREPRISIGATNSGVDRVRSDLPDPHDALRSLPRD